MATVLIVLLLALIVIGLGAIYYELRQRRELAPVAPAAVPVTPPIAEVSTPQPSQAPVIGTPALRIEYYDAYGVCIGHEHIHPQHRRPQRVYNGHVFLAERLHDNGAWHYRLAHRA